MARLLNARSLLVCLLAIFLLLQFVSLQLMTLQDDYSQQQFPFSQQPNLSGGSSRTTSTSIGSSSVNNDRNLEGNSNNNNKIYIDLEREISKGLEYAKSFTSTQRKLVFLHIPKAAGTTMEEVGGLQAKLAWGSCLFNHKPKRRGGVCKYPKDQLFEWPMKIGYWHLPTQLFPLVGTDPYKNADLFAIVRDPYDRLLSEFYYICRKKVTKWWDTVECNQSRAQEPEYMNHWLQEKLQRTTPSDQQLLSSSSTSPPSSAKDYLDHNGHFTPQYDFIVADGDIRMVDYVLRMDHLQPEFTALMKAYGIDASMPVHKRNAARNDTHDLNANHFDAQTHQLLYEKYAHDSNLLKRNGAD